MTNTRLRGFVGDEVGQDLIEYALLVTGLALVAVIAVQSLGLRVSSRFRELGTAVSSAGSRSGSGETKTGDLTPLPMPVEQVPVGETKVDPTLPVDPKATPAELSKEEAAKAEAARAEAAKAEAAKAEGMTAEAIRAEVNPDAAKAEVEREPSEADALPIGK